MYKFLSYRFEKSYLIAAIIPLSSSLIICRAFTPLAFFYFGAIFVLALHSIIILIYGQLNFNLKKSINLVGLGFLLFGIWAAITSIWSPFPQLTLLRAIYFTFISLSSLLAGYLWAIDKKNTAVSFLLPANLIIITTSLYSLILSIPEDAWTGGHGLGFKGYATHQNTLSSAIIITLPAILLPIIKASAKLNFSFDLKNFFCYKVLGFIALLVINIYFLISSVSRAAVLSLIFMIILFFIIKLSWKGKVVFIILFLLISIVTYNLSLPVRDFVMKTESHIGDRRIENLSETIVATKAGGFLGLGYGISLNPTSDKVKGYYLQDKKLFVREKMISVLALVEETGIIGLFLFLSPVFLVIIKLFRAVRDLQKNYGRFSELERLIDIIFLISVIIALCFHAQLEAWWVGIGSIQLPLFYMICGNALGSVSDLNSFQ